MFHKFRLKDHVASSIPCVLPPLPVLTPNTQIFLERKKMKFILLCLLVIIAALFVSAEEESLMAVNHRKCTKGSCIPNSPQYHFCNLRTGVMTTKTCPIDSSCKMLTGAKNPYCKFIA